MRYFVTIQDRTIEVDLSGDVPVIDGRELDVDLEAVSDGPLRHLLVDGSGHTLVARPGADRGAWDIHLDGHHFPDVRVVDERTKAIRAVTGESAAAKGPKPLRAPMPGLVVRVEVEEGQEIEPGQGLVIVEAMKMENELKADAAGVVSRIAAEAGEAVDKGAVLIEFSGD